MLPRAEKWTDEDLVRFVGLYWDSRVGDDADEVVRHAPKRARLSSVVESPPLTPTQLQLPDSDLDLSPGLVAGGSVPVSVPVSPLLDASSQASKHVGT